MVVGDLGESCKPEKVDNLLENEATEVEPTTIIVLRVLPLNIFEEEKVLAEE